MSNYRFSVIIEKDDDGCFTSCHEVQECYSQGDAYDEVIKNIKDAISAARRGQDRGGRGYFAAS
jgi:predicted RNase H-like HicB family nuclease